MIIYVSDALDERQHGGVSRSGFEFLLFLLMYYDDVWIVSTSKVDRLPSEFCGRKLYLPAGQFVVKRDNRLRKLAPYDVAKFLAKGLLDLWKPANLELSRHVRRGEPVTLIVNSFSPLHAKLRLDGVDVEDTTCVVRGSPESFIWQAPSESADPVKDAARFLDKFANLIFVSEICRSKWKPLLKNGRASFYLPNSIDEQEVSRISKLNVQDIRKEYGLDESRFHAVLVGSVQRRKGQDFLANVLDGMVRIRRDFLIHLVGVVSDPHGGLEIRKTVGRHPLSERVVFHGHREDALKFVHMADVALFTSRAEAFPRAVAEYMALGKSIISTNVSGIPEMIAHGVNGLLYDADDGSQFLECFRTLAQDTTLRDTLGARARETYYSRFSKAQQVNRALAIFEAIEQNKEASLKEARRA